MDNHDDSLRIFMFRLPLNAEEFDRLNMCCQHAGVGPGAFLRMLINKFWDELEMRTNEAEN